MRVRFYPGCCCSDCTCEGITPPDDLTIDTSGVNNCNVNFGGGDALSWNAAGYWEGTLSDGSETIEARLRCCGSGGAQGYYLEFHCVGSGNEEWVGNPCTEQGVGDGHGGVVQSNENSTCDPFYLEFDVVTVGGPCCLFLDGGINFVITE